MPIFPFHTWLPDAHVEAPTAGSVILAGVLLKMGTYGFLRFAIPFFPDVAFSPAVTTIAVVLAVIGIIYGALVAMVQPDIKKLVAYSSVSHLGFVMLGIWAATLQSVQGALMVMINHGLSTGALFFLIGMLYERRHTRDIAAFGGIARVVPVFSLIFTLVSLSSIGLPGLNGFVGEFLVLLGSFGRFPWATGIATTGVIFAAAYLLWALQRIIFNKLDKPENESLTDLTPRELAVLAPLLAGIVWLGLYPAPVLRRMEPTSRQFVESVQHADPPGRPGDRGAVHRGSSVSPIDTTSPMGVTLALLPEVVLSLAALGVLLRQRLAARDRGRLPARRLAQPGRGRCLAGRRSPGSWGAASDTAGIPQMVALDGYRYVGEPHLPARRRGHHPPVARLPRAGGASAARSTTPSSSWPRSG